MPRGPHFERLFWDRFLSPFFVRPFARNGKGLRQVREPAEGGEVNLRALQGILKNPNTPCYLVPRCGGYNGFRLCRRPPFCKAAG